MIEKSYFLIGEDDNIRDFSRLNVDRFTNKKVRANQHNINKIYNFSIQDGEVFLKEHDQMYILDLVAGNSDIVLPPNPLPMNYVILSQNLNNINVNLTSSNFQKIKIYGNGKRIMTYNEPLICDIPFVTLKLTFLDEQNGWFIC